MIKETSKLPEDSDFSRVYTYHANDGAACTVHELWVDKYGGCWLKSNDGQNIVIPIEIRGLISKRIRESQFR